jgi:collagenase-like PrtC family protease
MVWGRMPLAFSARCFTARHFNLSKDDCAFRCIEHPDGLAMRTQEDGEFLTLNGVQTQSGAVLDLLDQAQALVQLGVAALRVSPQSQGTLPAIAALAARGGGRVVVPEGVWYTGPWGSSAMRCCSAKSLPL